MQLTTRHPLTMLIIAFVPLAGHANDPVTATKPFQGKLATLPGTIEAEHFDEGPVNVAYRDADPQNQGADYREPTAVDIESRPDASNGHGLGWTKTGEWVIYSVEVKQTGTYTLSVPVACDGQGGTFHFEVDDKPITKKLQVPDTGGWDKLKTIRQTGIELTEGKHRLKLIMDTQGEKGATGDMDKFTFELSDNTRRRPGEGF